MTNIKIFWLKLLQSLLCLLLVLSSCLAHALVDVPALTQPVTDLTQTLSAAEQATLNAKLEAFTRDKGSQIAVLIVPTTQPEDIAQYSIRVAEQWKLGREKVDDGVLLLIAKNDRKMRVEVGYGLEGVIPDVYAKRIVSDVIAPYLKQGDFNGGITAGLDQIIQLINGEHLPAPDKVDNAEQSLNGLLPFLLIGGLISGLILRSIFGTFLGSAANGGLIGGAVFLLGLSLIGAGVLAIIAFFVTMMLGGRGINGYGGGYPGGYSPTSGGGFGGGGLGGDIFSGGGGDFGGGGASGDW